MRVLSTKWRRNPAGVDLERNDVIVTLCIPTKWRSYRDRRLCDVTPPYVYPLALLYTLLLVAPLGSGKNRHTVGILDASAAAAAVFVRWRRSALAAACE